MRERHWTEYLSDISTNIEKARSYVGSLSYEEFKRNDALVDATQLRLQNASEAARQLKHFWPDIMAEIEKRNPQVKWNNFRGFSSVSRHDYDLIQTKLLWRGLQQNGNITITEIKTKEEIAFLSQRNGIENREMPQRDNDSGGGSGVTQQPKNKPTAPTASQTPQESLRPAIEPPQNPIQGEKKVSTAADEPQVYDPSKDKQIDEFGGAHYFLSNNSPSPVVFEGVRYPTVTHAFAAARTLNETDRRRIAGIENPVEAQRAARELAVRPDWDKVQDPIMLALVRQKFQAEREKSRLQGTGNATLIHGNTLGDQTWGQDIKSGQGDNKLGNILMKVRDENARGVTHQQAQEDARPEKTPQDPAAKNEPEPSRPADNKTLPPESPFVIESKTERKPAERVLPGMSSRIHDNGDVSYRFNDLRSRVLGKDAFRDCGSTVRLEDKDERSIRAAVQYAKESWGNEAVVLRVAPDVRETVLREAVKVGLKVQNPELQKDIERLKTERSRSPFRRSDSVGTISRTQERERAKTPDR